VDWQQALCDVAAERFGAQWVEFELDTALRERSDTLTREKYAQPAYHRKR
jgi:hypothetical protein